jgi:hypothetical protein
MRSRPLSAAVSSADRWASIFPVSSTARSKAANASSSWTEASSRRPASSSPEAASHRARARSSARSAPAPALRSRLELVLDARELLLGAHARGLEAKTPSGEGVRKLGERPRLAPDLLREGDGLGAKPQRGDGALGVPGERCARGAELAVRLVEPLGEARLAARGVEPHVRRARPRQRVLGAARLVQRPFQHARGFGGAPLEAADIALDLGELGLERRSVVGVPGRSDACAQCKEPCANRAVLVLDRAPRLRRLVRVRAEDLDEVRVLERVLRERGLEFQRGVRERASLGGRRQRGSDGARLSGRPRQPQHAAGRARPARGEGPGDDDQGEEEKKRARRDDPEEDEDDVRAEDVFPQVAHRDWCIGRASRVHYRRAGRGALRAVPTESPRGAASPRGSPRARSRSPR